MIYLQRILGKQKLIKIRIWDTQFLKIFYSSFNVSEFSEWIFNYFYIFYLFLFIHTEICAKMFFEWNQKNKWPFISRLKLFSHYISRATSYFKLDNLYNKESSKNALWWCMMLLLKFFVHWVSILMFYASKNTKNQ